MVIANNILRGVAFAALLMPGIAQGQSTNSGTSTDSPPTAGNGDNLGEIVVTANKRSQNLQKTPSAISVVGQDAIRNGGVTDATQLSKLVPALVIGKQSASAVVFLRGVGQTNSSPAAQPGVSTNIDGIYLPRELAGGAFFDLERVEVLPGPQGTLYGRNAAGGAVNLVTRKPGKEMGIEGFIEAGNLQAVHAFTAINVPLGDTVAVRAAIDANRRDGYLSNGTNDANALAGRLGISLTPSDSLSLLVQYEHTRDRGFGPQNIMRGTDHPPYGSPTDPYFDSFPTDDIYQHNDGNIVTGEIRYDLGGVTLTYLPGYMSANNVAGVQFNGFLYSTFRSTLKQFSQEVRLTSDDSGRLKWLFGLFQYSANSAVEPDVGLPGGPIVNRVRIYNKLNSYAAFGEASYSLTDSFRLTLGGRYSIDTFDGNGSQTSIFSPQVVFAAKDTAHRADWKIGAEYDVGPQSLLYATAQSGYLQGGFTQADLASANPHTFKPVKLVAFTGGIKDRFLGNRLQINNEVFYYDYKDYQLQTIPFDAASQQTIFLVINVPKARIFGDQLDIAYSAGPNTDFNLSMIYLDAKITKGLNDTPSYQGFQLPNAPKFTANLAIEQRFPLASGGHIAARVATTINSGYWTVFTHDDFTHQDSFTKTDANLTYYAANGRWNVQAFVRNLEDSVVYYGSSSSEGPGHPAPTFIDVPRTYGVRVEFKY